MVRRSRMSITAVKIVDCGGFFVHFLYHCRHFSHVHTTSDVSNMEAYQVGVRVYMFSQIPTI
jgi:hypothetical protein